MHTIFLWFVVFAVGIPSAWRNPTAAALVLAKIAGWAIYRITGDNLPVEYYLFPDIFVLAVIMAKTEACDLQPYRDIWHQLKCFLLERSVPDRIVMLIFPIMWLLYVAPIHPYYVWWSLYWLVVAQFLAAGYEGYASLIKWWCARKLSTPIIDRHLTSNVIPFPCRDADATGAYQLARSEGGYG